MQQVLAFVLDNMFILFPVSMVLGFILAICYYYRKYDHWDGLDVRSSNPLPIIGMFFLPLMVVMALNIVADNTYYQEVVVEVDEIVIGKGTLTIISDNQEYITNSNDFKYSLKEGDTVSLGLRANGKWSLK